MFVETMRPTSVDLSKKGKSISSYKSKSTWLPSGYLSREKVELGQIVRLGIGGLMRPDLDAE